MTESLHSVIGVALNFRETLTRLAAMFATPPVAPVLYLKTPNTWIGTGHPIPCPQGVGQLRMAGTLGVIISQIACRVAADDATRHIGGYVIVNDVSIAHESYYRPALRERCSDSFCVIGAATEQLPVQTEFEIDVVVNNVLRSSVRTTSLVRPIPQLISDISQFMTLRAGDILLVGEPDTSPLCSPGDRVRVEIPGLGAIENKVAKSL